MPVEETKVQNVLHMGPGAREAFGVASFAGLTSPVDRISGDAQRVLGEDIMLPPYGVLWLA